MADIVAQKIIIELANGYTIRQDADLTNEADGITYNDFQLVNPEGNKVLIHDEDINVLVSIGNNPVFVARLEDHGTLVA